MSKSGSKFVIRGTVSRKPYVGEKFARVSLTVEGERRATYLDVKTFAANVMSSISELRENDQVTIEGEVASEKVMDGKNDVLVRDRPLYVPMLKATKVWVGWGKADEPPPPKTRPAPPPVDDSDIPF